MMGNINFRIVSKETKGNGTKLTIHMVNSNREMVTTNEMPVILHAINGSVYAKPTEESETTGFAYTFGNFIF